MKLLKTINLATCTGFSEDFCVYVACKKLMESAGCRLTSYMTWNGKFKYLNTFFFFCRSVTAASDMPFCPLLKYCFATTYSSTHILAALLPLLYCLMNKVSILFSPVVRKHFSSKHSFVTLSVKYRTNTLCHSKRSKNLLHFAEEKIFYCLPFHILP